MANSIAGLSMRSRPIDLSRLPFPDVIQRLDYETLFSQAQQRFLQAWADLRTIDPDLPDYTVQNLETDPAMVVLQAGSYRNLLNLARVNDAAKALLAPFAKGSDLDAIAARQNVERLKIRDATSISDAVYESDDQLLRRYLYSFGRASAGSTDAYLYEAFTAAPDLGDAVTVGRAIHGRAGDTDIVIMGQGGSLPSSQQIDAVRSAVTSTSVKPEALGAFVRSATPVLYSDEIILSVPSGPDVSLIANDADQRVREAAGQRTFIGGEIPDGLITGAAYGPNVLSVSRPIVNGTQLVEPVISPSPYVVPVLDSLTVTTEIVG